MPFIFSAGIDKKPSLPYFNQIFLKRKLPPVFIFYFP